MKLLFIEWNSFGNQDILEAFNEMNIQVSIFPFEKSEPRVDPHVSALLSLKIKQEHPDLVFSFNYFPLISNVCKETGVPYYAWVYDSPYVLLYSYTLINPCNHIYLFDKEQYLEFANAGAKTVHYLPLAVNAKRLGSLSQAPAIQQQYRSDIAFVGSLYTEKHNFFDRMKNLPEHTRGYLAGLMESQLKVFGYNFIKECLPSDIMDDLKANLPLAPNTDGVETYEYLFSQYVINRKITAIERDRYLKAIACKQPLDLYTPDQSYAVKGITNHGPVDYYDGMPYVFQNAKINLNISLRSIQSGIPLRALDIMGCGGFLLTNFQADFLDYFIPDEDFVYYESEQDLLNKIDFYLIHDAERKKIAASGQQKVLQNFSYVNQLQKMFSDLF
ncbi:MAG: DUF3880 domain-containing protein [Lachnospiraceae bacterium]|nr:DUF3880 domain-containing protein [Lachnospiraceae bacterium]